MSSNRPNCRVRHWSAGAGLAAAAAAVIGMGTAHADDTSPLDLLGDAQSALTNANQVLGQIDVSGLTGDEAGVGPSITTLIDTQDHALTALDKLDSAESAILSVDNGSLSNFISPLFTNLDQQWYQTTEALLSADQSIASAVSGGSFADILAAQIEALAPDAQLVSDSFQSIPTDWIGSLFGAGGSATEAASELTSSAAATPDDVIGQAITDLNQGTTVLDTASTADLGTPSADLLSGQEGLASQLDPLLTQLGSLQDQLTPTDQTLLAGVDEQLASAAQNILSADQAFVAADQAGDLGGSGFTSADFTVIGADLNFLGSFLTADGAGIFADLTGGFDPSSAADLASSLDPATVIDPSIFADVLSSIGL
jgi:hypothetical protein